MGVDSALAVVVVMVVVDAAAAAEVPAVVVVAVAEEAEADVSAGEACVDVVIPPAAPAAAWVEPAESATAGDGERDLTSVMVTSVAAVAMAGVAAAAAAATDSRGSCLMAIAREPPRVWDTSGDGAAAAACCCKSNCWD